MSCLGNLSAQWVSDICETEIQPSTRLNATQKISTKGRGAWELHIADGQTEADFGLILLLHSS